MRHREIQERRVWARWQVGTVLLMARGMILLVGPEILVIK